MRLVQIASLQLVIFLILFVGYQFAYRSFPINGVINNIIYVLIVIAPSAVLFRHYKMIVSVPAILLSSILNIVVGLYVLASVFRDGL